MAGKFYDGVAAHGGFLAKESIAFGEGIWHRAQGTAIAYPVTDNPHAAGSDANAAWAAGWTVANAAAPGTIAQTAAPNIAIPTTAISA